MVADPATTALLIFDVIDHIPRIDETAEQMVPAIAALRRRHGRLAPPSSTGLARRRCRPWSPGFAAPGDIRIEIMPKTILQYRSRRSAEGQRITTLILTGWKVSGSVTYTSVGATLRGYTVVVPIDATLDATEYEIVIGQFQILNQNSSNAANEPLKNRASTLSRTDLITFK